MPPSSSEEGANFIYLYADKLKFIGINKRIKAAGVGPLPYDVQIGSYVYYRAALNFKISTLNFKYRACKNSIFHFLYTDKINIIGCFSA